MGGRTKNETGYEIEVKIRGVIKNEVGSNRYKKRVRVSRRG
jgi:cobyrinic acid a,c-diamide synthase